MISIDGAFWIVLTGALATSSCALLGTFLVLRKMSLLGDALSHAILPGIAIAFCFPTAARLSPCLLGQRLVGC